MTAKKPPAKKAPAKKAPAKKAPAPKRARWDDDEAEGTAEYDDPAQAPTETIRPAAVEPAEAPAEYDDPAQAPTS